MFRTLRLFSLSFIYRLYDLICFRSGGIPARNAKGERLLLFIGIIDILQSYRLKKKLEHTWKSMIHDGVRIAFFCSVDVWNFKDGFQF